MANSDQRLDSPVAPRLGLWDAVSIIVGIVVGTSIFRTPAVIFSKAAGPWAAMGLWFMGGLLAWCGAVCYAELAVAYPRDGGDYEYLKRAFGPWCGFLFAWAQITSVISANIAIMACAFADYAGRAWESLKPHTLLLTIGPVFAISFINTLGIVAGKTTQNVLTLTKVVGLGGIIAVGALMPGSNVTASAASSPNPPGKAAADIGLALVFVLYAYGGWSHAAYVAAEVRDVRRNLPRALVLGIAVITFIYLAVNAAYLQALGYDRIRSTNTPATDVLELALGPMGGRVISILVMLSALGAINGMILTASRIYAVWGADYPAIHWLGAWNRRTHSPVAAIALQAVVASLLIALVGTVGGRRLFDAPLRLLSVEGIPWDQFNGGFETLVAASAPVYWGLCFLTGVAVFKLRSQQHAKAPSFRMPFYPIPALAFCVTCLYMLWASLSYARWLTLIGIAPLACGVFVWLFKGRSAQTMTK